jgi:AcrR family transcriptional regulator
MTAKQPLMPAQRAWGAGSPPVDVIVAAALDLIDREGLTALTTRRLAAQLDTFQPAIYRRVADRDALLDLVADAVMAEAGLPDADPADWRAWLHECAVRVRAAWRRHPHAAPLMHHGGAHPAILQILSGIVDVMSNTFDEADVPACLQVYLGYVFGTALLESLGQEEQRRPADSELRLTFERYAQITGSPEDAFLQGLDIVLDGLASRRRGPGKRGSFSRASVAAGRPRRRS